MRIEPKVPSIVGESLQVDGTESIIGGQQSPIVQNVLDSFEHVSGHDLESSEVLVSSQSNTELLNEIKAKMTQSHLSGPMSQIQGIGSSLNSNNSMIGTTSSPLSAKFAEVNESASGDWGTTSVSGTSNFGKTEGEIQGDIGLKNDSAQVEIGANGKLEALGHHYDIGYKTPGVNLGGHTIDLDTKVGVDAEIGMKGEVQAGISVGNETGINVGGEGFAGASASLEYGAEVGDIGGYQGQAKAWVGVGAAFNPDIGFKDGKFHANLNLGLALGIGAQVDLGFTINYKEIGKILQDAGLATANLLNKGIFAATKFGIKKLPKSVKAVFNGARNAVKDAAKVLPMLAKSTGNILGGASKAAGNVVEGVAKGAGNALGSAAKAGKSFVDSIF